MAKKRTSNSRRRKSGAPVDVKAILNKSVKVGRDGQTQTMAPFEAILRAQVKSALKNNNLSAIRSLLLIAEKHQLVLPAPKAPQNGGVRIWPRLFTAKFGDDLFGEVPKAKTDSNDDPDDKPK